ncbi:MAG: hypothetical protein H0V17_08140 [Deltaproteobacteria bacterium]|nr:hypothetical protein [Deltaproteobacteria bacterium]
MKTSTLLVLACAVGCTKSEPVVVKEGSGSATPGPGPTQVARHDQIARTDFNRWAVRLNLPIYWIADPNANKSLDADEVATLLFYPTAVPYTANGAFNADFERAYDQIVTASKATQTELATDEAKRLKLVGDDLDYGRATLVRSDFTKLAQHEKAFVSRMMTVASLIDELYDQHTGAAALAARLPADAASRSLFRRNRGPKCVAPNTEKDPACTAIPGAPKPIVDLYPAELQKDDGNGRANSFCVALEKHPKAKELLAPFVAVRGDAAALTAVPYTEAYKDKMTLISKELSSAANAIAKDPKEQALVTYLRAASAGFATNNWEPADEAWSKMTVDNSKWYVRVAPDETYWEPCSQKAGMHLTFALINQGSREWQSKLVPAQQEMEVEIAKRAGKPYTARKVTFHLPDFIDIVVNAGDDRDALGATIGQSLPNWGPVANEGRGRTVAMSNLYTDPDSMAARRGQAESLLDAASMKAYAGDASAGLLATILHEATHNLGPSHEYKVDGKDARTSFTGPIAQLMEELKAQAGALFLVEFLRAKKIISDELAAQSYVDTVVWAFGHISQGMYEADGKRKTYPEVAAIQNGYLIEKGALVWDDKATAANGKDTGAFRIDMSKMVTACDEMMKDVAGIKARGDKAGAEALIKKFVDGTVVPHPIIKERYLRFPKANFVYSVAM